LAAQKIIVISPAHPLRGGIATSSERLAQAIQAAGHTVVVYSFSLQYPAFLFPGKSQFTDEPAPAGLHIKTVLNSINPFNWIGVARAIAREKPDRIVVRFWLPLMGPCLGSVLRLAAWFAQKKPHVTALVDNIIPHEKRPGDRPFARYFVGACHDFVVMSQSVGQEIKTFAQKPVRFAPHPIYDNYGAAESAQVAREALKLPLEVPMVLFFGFIRQYKGLDLLLEALALTPDIHLVVAGECYDDWANYQKILEAHQLQNRVHLFTDFIPTDQVRLFFSAANLVVQPYRTATQSGISQIAYHFEKPMVVTRVGGLPEIVRHGVSGYVVAPEPAEIARAMRDFFDHHREADMQEGVRAEKQRFTWEYLVAQCLAG
jgi:D-inositol-3-phosphate glycosyltransferase